jgi:hypothetical protein
MDTVIDLISSSGCSAQRREKLQRRQRVKVILQLRDSSFQIIEVCEHAFPLFIQPVAHLTDAVIVAVDGVF